MDYTSTTLMCATLGLAGFVFALVLKRVDRRRTIGQRLESLMRS